MPTGRSAKHTRSLDVRGGDPVGYSEANNQNSNGGHLQDNAELKAKVIGGMAF
jgi:hypothetical protein